MIGELTNDEVDEIFARHYIAHLGCHADGETYVVPISYAWDGDRILGQTTPGRKIEMMRTNPKVCIQVEEFESIVQWRSAIAWGEYRELDGGDRSLAMGKIIDRLSPLLEETAPANRSLREVTPEKLSRGGAEVVYEIKIQKRSGRFERS